MRAGERTARRGGAAAAGCVCASAASELADARGNMAATEAAVPALPNSGGVGAGAPSGTVPVLFCFSVFARPSSVPHGAGYELLIQKFLSLYGDQLDMHRKFVVQLFAEEWGQYVDLPKGFAVSERCKVRLVPLQIQVGPAGGGSRAPRRCSRSPCVPVPTALLRCPAPPGPCAPRRSRQPRRRPRECAGPKVTVTSWWRRALTPPRVWSSASRIRFVCRELSPSLLRNHKAVQQWLFFFWGDAERGGKRLWGVLALGSCVHHLREHKLQRVRPFPPPLPQRSVS